MQALLMRAQGWTHKQIAAALGVSVSTSRRWTKAVRP